MKKAWEKPRLTLLSKGTPQEAVLAKCKRLSSGSDKIGFGGSYCLHRYGYCSKCKEWQS